MGDPMRPPALDPATVAGRKGSSYSHPYREPLAGRVKRALGDAAGLTRFGVNLVELGPGDWSAPRHWHSHEDEFVFVLDGTLTLVTEAGEQSLGPGMAAGFPAGRAEGHHLINKSGRPARYLEVGGRSPEDLVHYPDADLLARSGPDGRIFTNRRGEPYR